MYFVVQIFKINNFHLHSDFPSVKAHFGTKNTKNNNANSMSPPARTVTFFSMTASLGVI